MPLFMDRHELPGATIQQAAEAHTLDVGMAGKYDVRFLAYWFDADHGRAFCFADAPDPRAMEVFHRETHGLIPNEIIPVAEGDVLRFLGRINEPMGGASIDTAFRAIMFTDLEGSTALLDREGEAAYMVLLTEHDLILRRALVEHHGREVKHTGDGIMASFDDVSRALDCAVAIQEGFGARTASGATPPLRVRIGLDAGEPVDRDADLFGATVNLARRICDSADAGQVLVSEPVHDLAVGHGFECREAPARELKGFAGTHRVFELVRAGTPTTA